VADAKLLNLRQVQYNLSRVPQAAADALRSQMKTEADDFVDVVKSAMASQYDHEDNDHERLIDSVHAYPNPDREISYHIIADAKDDKGQFIGSHVEQGHKARDGSHVAPQPAFWPAWRSFRDGMRKRLATTARTAVKRQFEQGS
jgi:hypothetical protein